MKRRISTLIIGCLLLFYSHVEAAVEFDGIDDYIDLSINSTLDITTGESFTLSLWVKTTESYGTIISLRHSVNSWPVLNLSLGYNGWHTNPGHLLPLMRFDDNTGLKDIDGGIINDGEWHFVCVRFDNPNDTLSAFKDTTKTETPQPASGSITTDLRAIAREKRWLTVNFTTSDNIHLSGQVTEVYFWDTPLTDTEIILLAQEKIKGNGLQIQPSNLRLYLPLDDYPEGRSGDRAIFTDSSMNRNYGIGYGLVCRGETILTYPKNPPPPDKTMGFQGTLEDSQGRPLTGLFSVNLRIYDSKDGDTPLWNETQDIGIEDGLLDIELGKVTPLDLLFDRQYWLGIEVESDGEMSPRFKLKYVPYAFYTKK